MFIRLGDLRRVIRETIEDDSRMDTYEENDDALTGAELEKIHTSKIATVHDFDVYEVDGAYVRLHVDIDFVGGGNPGRYSYVPDDEIWVEDTYEPVDVSASVLHEIVEALLMIEDGLDYDHAHDLAATQELKFRKHVEKEANVPLEKLDSWIDVMKHQEESDIRSSW